MWNIDNQIDKGVSASTTEMIRALVTSYLYNSILGSKDTSPPTHNPQGKGLPSLKSHLTTGQEMVSDDSFRHFLSDPSLIIVNLFQ